MRTAGKWLKLCRKLHHSRSFDVGDAKVSALYDEIFTDALMVLLNVGVEHTLKSVVLTFMQEHSSKLFREREHLVKFMRAAEHMLKQRAAGAEKGALQLVQGQVLVTWTSILIDLDTIRIYRKVFEGFVSLLCRVLFAQSSLNSNLRLMACASLRELELTYPCLLEHLVTGLVDDGEDELVVDSSTLDDASRSYASTDGFGTPKLQKRRSRASAVTTPMKRHHRASLILEMCQRECSHAASSFIALMLLILEHAYARKTMLWDDESTKSVARRILADAISVDGTPSTAATASDADEKSAPTTPTSSNVSTPDLVRKTARVPVSGLGKKLTESMSTIDNSSKRRSSPPPLRAKSRSEAKRGKSDFIVSATTQSFLSGSRDFENSFRRRIPSANYLRDMSSQDHRANVVLPPTNASRVLPALSVAFESLTLMSHWQRVAAISRLATLADILDVRSGVVQHHLLPYLHMRSPLVCHALILLHAGSPGLLTDKQERALVLRICHLVRDHKTLLQHRILAVQWLRYFPSHSTERSFALLHEHAEQLYPETGDPLDLRVAKLGAILSCFRVENGRGATIRPPPVLRALGSIREWPYHRADSRFSNVANRFLLRALRRFPQLCHRIASLLVRVTCVWPHLVTNTVRFVDAYASLESSDVSKSIQVYILQRLASALPTIVPTVRISHFFSLMERIGREPMVDPTPVIRALLHLVAEGEGICVRGSWQLGMRLLAVCSTIMSCHPPSLILASLGKLLRFVEIHYGDVDVRDRARVFRNLLEHVRDPKLSRILPVSSSSYAVGTKRSTNLRERFAPRSDAAYIRTVNVSSILQLRRSRKERQRLGVFDGGSADISMSCARELLSETADARQDLDEEEEDISGAHVDERVVTRLFVRYRNAIRDGRSKDVPTAIHLPFHLTYRHKSRDQADETGGVANNEEQEREEDADATLQSLYALVLELSPSPDYAPVRPIALPYLRSTKETKRSRKATDSNTTGRCASNDVDDDGAYLTFPYGYKIVLALRPVAPVPATFSLRLVFTDTNGQCCEGQLHQVSIFFQDLFLPIPATIVASPESPSTCHSLLTEMLFEPLWNALSGDEDDDVKSASTMQRKPGAGESSQRNTGCTSAVKLLLLDHVVVVRCIERRLGPFVVPSTRMSERARKTLDADAEEEWYAQGLANALGRGSSTTTSTSRVLEVKRVAIFLPPGYHMLMIFHISAHSTVVRIRTDYWQILSEVDEYFCGWDGEIRGGG
eukprot:g279.t1